MRAIGVYGDVPIVRARCQDGGGRLLADGDTVGLGGAVGYRSEQRSLSPATPQRTLVAASGPALAELPIDALTEMGVAGCLEAMSAAFAFASVTTSARARGAPANNNAARNQRPAF